MFFKKCIKQSKLIHTANLSTWQCNKESIFQKSELDVEMLAKILLVMLLFVYLLLKTARLEALSTWQ